LHYSHCYRTYRAHILKSYCTILNFSLQYFFRLETHILKSYCTILNFSFQYFFGFETHIVNNYCTILNMSLRYFFRLETWRPRTRTGWATLTSGWPCCPTRNEDSKQKSKGELSTHVGMKLSTLKVILNCLKIL
jgi:hypothetical protein